MPTQTAQKFWLRALFSRFIQTQLTQTKTLSKNKHENFLKLFMNNFNQIQKREMAQ